LGRTCRPERHTSRHREKAEHRYCLDACRSRGKKALETATGGEGRGSTPADMRLLVRSEIAKWSKVIDEAKIARID
jgi:hypothetical protein